MRRVHVGGNDDDPGDDRRLLARAHERTVVALTCLGMDTLRTARVAELLGVSRERATDRGYGPDPPAAGRDRTAPLLGSGRRRGVGRGSLVGNAALAVTSHRLSAERPSDPTR